MPLAWRVLRGEPGHRKGKITCMLVTYTARKIKRGGKIGSVRRKSVAIWGGEAREVCDREGDICVKVKKWMTYFVNVTVTCFFEGNLLELKKSSLAKIK